MKPQPKTPVCPCCGHSLPGHDRDEFASVFRIWSHAHRIALDMNGAAKSEALAMMVRWERMFREWMDPLPTPGELKDATDFMLQTEETAKAPWIAHFAIIKRRILSQRDKARITREMKERLEAAKLHAARGGSIPLKTVTSKIGEMPPESGNGIGGVR